MQMAACNSQMSQRPPRVTRPLAESPCGHIAVTAMEAVKLKNPEAPELLQVQLPEGRPMTHTVSIVTSVLLHQLL